MPEVHVVIGRVIPERKGFSHECRRLFSEDRDYCVVFRVEDGQLIAKVIGEVGHLSNFNLKSIVTQAEQIVLNVLTFTHGEVFDVDIVAILPHGSSEYHYQDNSHDIIRSRDRQVDFDTVWAVCQSAEGVHLRRALNDLRMALTHVEDGPFYCYRALETIRRAIVEEEFPNNLHAQGDHMCNY